MKCHFLNSFVKFVCGNVKASKNTGNVSEGGLYLKNQVRPTANVLRAVEYR